MRITGTYVSYFHYCKRRLWLFANDIKMEHNSDLVKEGKLIEENSYITRAKKGNQIEIENIKIDFFDFKNKIIHETKRTDSNIYCDIAQLKYYLYVLDRNGIQDVKGILEYPRLRETEQVFLKTDDKIEIAKWEKEIHQIIHKENPPEKIKKSLCKHCAYFEFCWISA